MQTVEPCVQEAPLKEVLLTLGLAESQLTDLHNVVSWGEKAVFWRLSLQSGNSFDSFAVIFWR